MTKDAIPQRIAVDANFLVAYVNPALADDTRARLEYLLARVEKAKAQIIIPMPALAEFLVRADTAGIEVMNKLERKAFVLAAPFDRMAAFECALIDRAALGAGAQGEAKDANGKGAKKDGVDAPWQKIKIDRQVVAIAKARGAQWMISADASVRSNALRVGMQALTVDDLDLPESARQGKLELVQTPTSSSSA